MTVAEGINSVQSRDPTTRLNWIHAGRVEELWLRNSEDAAPVRSPRLRARVGLGLEGDCHAEAHSPRQVLLASSTTYQTMHLEPATLRENVTLSVGLRDFVSGTLVRIGDRALLRITFPCDPCSRLNRRRTGLMRTVGAERGVLARVV